MTRPPAGPAGSEQPLVERYDVALLDLDGVVYVGQDAVPGAPDSLAAARAAGLRLGFVTNNAANSAAAVAARLTALGVPADPEDVITSAQTAARVLSERLAPGARVLVVGTDDLAAELTARGLTPVRADRTDPDAGPVDAVVQGYSPDTSWRDLAAACRAVRSGAVWVATNADSTLPSPDGPLPGNGSLVDVVRRTTGVQPVVTGKPDPAMHRECLDRTGARSPLVVGDRLDTDVDGASRVGCASMIVLTGVVHPVDLLAAPAGRRPTYLAADLGGLLDVHPAVTGQDGRWDCRGWSVNGAAEALTLRGDGTPMDALRALCAAAWATDGTAVTSADRGAAAVLSELGLPDASEHLAELEQVQHARLDAQPAGTPPGPEAQ